MQAVRPIDGASPTLAAHEEPSDARIVQPVSRNGDASGAFRDDECGMQTDKAPFNLSIVKHIAQCPRTGKSKDSRRMRRKVAA
jgi:hypothetical protein